MIHQKVAVEKRQDGILRGTDHSEILLELLEGFAKNVDNSIQSELFKKLVLQHSQVARKLEETAAQLAESESRLSEAQSIAQLGRWDLDYASGELGWSRSMNRILGMDESTQGSTELFLRFIHPDDRKKMEAIMQRLRTEKEPWTARYRLLLADGRVRWIQVQLLTRFDESGEPLRSYGTVQDISMIKEAEDKLESYSRHLEDMVSAKVKEISEAQIATIFALVKLAESRDDDTGAHVERTASFCQLLAQKAGKLEQYQSVIDEEFHRTIYHASPLHDIGKVGIPDQILLKPGKLTPKEIAIMKTHVEIGYQTLESIDNRYVNNAFIQMGREITRYHHEKWDGSGYMAGLKGEEIPLSARIMALADVYDALRSKRVYKSAYSHEKSLQIMKEGRGTHFDPVLLDLMVEYNEEFAELFDRIT